MLRSLALAGILVLSPLAAAQEMSKLDMPKADVRDVLKFYGHLAKKRVVLDSTVQGQLSIVSEGPISREQAMLLIERSFLANGYYLVDRGSDEVILLGITKNPRSAGVPIISRPEDIPNQERVITFVFRLKHREPVEVQQMLQQYVPVQVYTSFVVDPRAKLLFVTESVSVVRKLQDFVKEVDVPVPPMKPTPPALPPTR